MRCLIFFISLMLCLNAYSQNTIYLTCSDNEVLGETIFEINERQNTATLRDNQNTVRVSADYVEITDSLFTFEFLITDIPEIDDIKANLLATFFINRVTGRGELYVEAQMLSGYIPPEELKMSIPDLSCRTLEREF